MESHWRRWLFSLSEERQPSKRADGRLVPSQTYLDHFEYVRICALSTSYPAMITIFHPQGGARAVTTARIRRFPCQKTPISRHGQLSLDVRYRQVTSAVYRLFTSTTARTLQSSTL